MVQSSDDLSSGRAVDGKDVVAREFARIVVEQAPDGVRLVGHHGQVGGENAERREPHFTAEIDTPFVRGGEHARGV